MTKPIVSPWQDIPTISLQQYERYLPNAFDESLSILEKVNKLIKYLDDVGVLLNGIGNQWNLIVDWVMNEGLEDAVKNQLLLWLNDGTLGELIQEIVGDISKVYSIVSITNPSDITNDVKAALEKIKTGGTLFIPYGDYIMHDYVELYDNVTVTAPMGTTIRKTLASVSGYAFLDGKSTGTSGYGGGGKNITIENITFRGFPQDGTNYMSNGFAFNHIDGITLRNLTFIDCMFNGHCVDLAGCSNVLIEDCTFSGQYLIVGREYTEAIQIDSSTPAGIGSEWSGLDGLPTKNVVVQRCKFIPSAISPAPQPIGNHGYTGGSYYENIVFDNNLVIDCFAYSDAAWRGWIHFYAVKNLKITNNKFKNTSGASAYAIGLLTSSGGNYDPVTLIAGTGTPMKIMNVEISGNVFEGFGFNSMDLLNVIRSYGTTYNNVSYPTTNINIHDNQFINCGRDDMTLDVSTGMIHIYHFDTVSVRGNSVDKGRNLASVWDGTTANISNNYGQNLASQMVYCADASNIVISNNVADHLRRPIDTEELNGFAITHNVATNVIQSKTEDYSYRFRNPANGLIMGNVLQTSDPTQAYGYYVYDTLNLVQHVRNFDNLAVGVTSRPYNTSGTSNFVDYVER